MADEAGFQTTVHPINAGAPGRLPAMAVKLNGVTAYTNPFEAAIVRLIPCRVRALGRLIQLLRKARR